MSYKSIHRPWYRRALKSITNQIAGLLAIFSGWFAIFGCWLAIFGIIIGTILVWFATAALPIILVLVCLKYLFF